MKKVCLISTPSPFLLDERVFPFLGILKVASAWREQGADVDFLDLSGLENYEEVVKEYLSSVDEVEFIGITATTPQMPIAFKIGELIKSISPQIKLAIGGSHVTLMHTAAKKGSDRAAPEIEKIQNVFDVIVAGDGELTLEPILKLEHGVIDVDDKKSPYFLSNKDFSTLPFPARDLIDLTSYKYTIEGENATSLIAQLGCPYRCIGGDERVSTSKGLLKISELTNSSLCEAKDFEIEISSEEGKTKTSHFLNQGTQPAMKLLLTTGQELVAHPNHRIRVARNGELIWCEVKNVLDTDHVVVRVGSDCYPTEYVKLSYGGYDQNITNSGNFVAEEFETPKVLDEKLSWLMGFLIGDGSFGESGITFAVSPDLETKLRKVVLELFGYEIKVYPIKATTVVKQAWIYSRQIKDFFRKSLDFKEENKHRVSELIFQSPKSVIESFIQGLWDADAYKEGDYFVTAYESLAKEVSTLERYVGNHVSVQRIFNKTTERTSFRVKRLRRDGIPIYKSTYVKNGKLFFRKVKSPNRIFVNKSSLKKFGVKHELLNDNWRFVKMLRRTVTENQVLFDLTVPNVENYIASSVINHNCSFCSGRSSPYLRLIRNRSTESVIEELEFLHKTYGYKGFMLYDDELNVNKNMIQLMEEIKKLADRYNTKFKLRGFTKSELFTEEQAEAMKMAGFTWLLTGFESGDPKILEIIDKNATVEDNTRCVQIAKKHGLKVKALMSMGHAGESKETITNTKNWLLDVKPDDFDCTVITTYPGSPYFDKSVRGEDCWVYTCPKTGSKLYQKSLDYTKEADYYKGVPGDYVSFVWTDFLSAKELAKERDDLENEVRKSLNIPFNPSAQTKRYEHSMGQGNSELPNWILRRSKKKKFDGRLRVIK